MKKICINCKFAEPENIDKEYKDINEMMEDERLNEYKLICTFGVKKIVEDENSCEDWRYGL